MCRYKMQYRPGIIILAAMVLYGTGACSDELQPPVSTPSSGSAPIELKAAIEQQAQSRADESGFADGDRMGIFVVNYTDGTPGTLTVHSNQADNVAFTLDAERGRWQASADVCWLDDKTPADVIGYYPYTNTLASVDAFPFEVSADQSAPGSNGEPGAYEASDFLWAKAEACTPGEPVNLIFRHRMAGVQVILQQGEGFTQDEWSGLQHIVTVNNTVRSCTIDLADGKATPTGDFDRNILMNGDDEDCYRAVVVPQTVAAGKAVIGITLDGIAYNYVRPSDMAYTPGKLHKFTMRVDRKSSAGKYSVNLVSEQISDWEADHSSHDFEANSYLVVECASAGTLKNAIKDADADFRTVKNLKVSGTIDWTDFEMMRSEMDALTSVNLKDVRVVNAITNKINGGAELESAVDDCLPIDAFNGKSTLRRIILPESINRLGVNSLANLRLTSTLIIPDAVTRFDDWALAGIGEEASIVLPNKLEYIGAAAFYGTRATFELKLPSTLKYIGGAAFHDCENAYGTFALPPGLEYLGGGAFDRCGTKLQGDIVIPVALTSVPRICPGFANGTNLVLHEGVRIIEDGAFSGLRFNSPIVFPKGLERIDHEAFAFCRFAGGMELPAGLKFLDDGAFLETNFGGELTYPSLLESTAAAFNCTDITSLTLGERILQIGAESFARCSSLRKATIGKNVEYIGNNAFSECRSLQTIICMAKTPPAAKNESFNGIYFDKCVLEVPVGCVDAYRNSSGWNRFLNITEHHELAVNLPEIACLDRGVSRNAIVRAEGPWRVTECPDWVKVSPSSGSGKEEITVTVEAQNLSAENRSGEIIFSLNASGYSCSTAVRQLSADHGEDREIVLQTASAGADAVPLFIVGEGFTADQIVSGEYSRVMNETMEQFFAIEPYKTLRPYFTVSTAYACSPEEGTGDVATLKQTCFNTDAVTPDTQLLREYVRRVSSHAGSDLSRATVIVVCNYNAFAGWSEIGDDGLCIASIGRIDDVYPYDQRGLVQHFAGGEAFAGLGNEGVGHFHHIKGCPCPLCADLGRFQHMKSRGLFANLSLSGKMNEAPWREFIFHPDYSNAVDMWEGGYNHIRGVWRSEANSVMNTYISYFNAISRYTIYRGVMRRAGQTASFEHFTSIDKRELP